jgi:hypothetical protein
MANKRREDESKYVANGGKGTLFVVGDAQDGLRELARNFPGQFARSLGKLGSLIRQDIRAAMEAEGPAGGRWAPLVKWKPNVPESSSRKRRRKRRSRYSTSARNFFEKRFFGETRTGKPYGRIYSAGRYLLNKEKLTVQAGWVTDSAARTGKRVQAALRGIKSEDPRFDGSQPVTRAMRRALAAAGLVLPKSKRTLRQQQRPLMRRIFQNFEPQIPGLINRSVARYLAEGKSS